MYINKKPSELGPYSQTALCFPPSPYPHLLFTAIATAYPLPKKAASSPRKFPAPASFHCPPPTTSSSTKNPPGKSSSKSSLPSSNATTPTPAPQATDRRYLTLPCRGTHPHSILNSPLCSGILAYGTTP